jgi:pyruvate dehydrogenase E2 component (dihydrolipoamide acetyltransferase)
MAISVVMPALEMAQETGKLVSWKKKAGEQVKKGETLLEVETDKAVVEIEAQGDGILGGVTAKEGDVVPVGQTIAWLLKPGEQPPANVASAQTGRKMDSAAAAAATLPLPSRRARLGCGRQDLAEGASSRARSTAVDIATLRGSGPGGEILAEDIMKASLPASASAAQLRLPRTTARPTSPPSAAPSGPPDAVSSIGRIMAERTTQSWTTVPHFFVTREVDATALNATRERWIPIVEKSHGVKVTHTDFIVAAVARALHLHPRMNGSWANDKITLNSHVNVALAMAVENAVVTAVIRDTDRIGLGDIAKQRKELAERAPRQPAAAR